MGHGRLGSILAYAWVGLVVFFACTAHTGASETSNVELTLTLNRWQKLILTFSQTNFRSLISRLCNDRQSTWSFQSNYDIMGVYSLPTTISGNLDDLVTWHITISDEEEWFSMRWHSYLQYKLTRHNSNVSDLRCWKKEDREILIGNPSCSSKPQIVYLGGSRWLVIEDKVEVVTYKYDDDNTDCDVGCMGNCGNTPTTITTPTPLPIDSTESVVNNTGSNTDIFIGNITNIIMGNETETTGTASPQTESSSDQTPVIVGVVIAVLIVLILVVVLAVILWRRRKSKQPEANPEFAASNPGAYVDAEFIHGGNAQSQAAQSVPTLPPPYSEVERNPQHGFTNDGYGVSGDVQI